MGYIVGTVIVVALFIGASTIIRQPGVLQALGRVMFGR